MIITNPTHVAVALKYDKDNMAAPVVLAKGYDEVAQRIKAIAAEYDIPMVESEATVRAAITHALRAPTAGSPRPTSSAWRRCTRS